MENFRMILASLLLSLLLGAEATSRDVDQIYTHWGYNVQCKKTNDACVTCACTTNHTHEYWGDYNMCTTIVKTCRGAPCVDAVKEHGKCCKTCPNGDNCRIYGKIYTPDPSKKIHKPGDKSEYSKCLVNGWIHVCTITKTPGEDGWVTTTTSCKLVTQSQ